MSRRPLVGLFLLVVVAGGVAVAGGVGATVVAHSDHGGTTTTPVEDASQSCSFPVTVTDATGHRVTVDERPERIVALQPSVAQTLWEIGARDRVVGMPVNEYTAYLNGSDDRTNVVHADDYNTDVETVVSLEPDVVLAPNVVSNETVDRLRQVGLTVYGFGYGRSLADIYRKTNRTGRLVGECTNATTVVGAMQTRVDRIRRAVAGRERPRVLYRSGQYTAGDGTFVHDVIRIAGGRNVAAGAGIDGYRTISDEVVLERDPEWIVHTGDSGSLSDRAAYANTTAIRRNQTVVLDSNLLSQPAPRVVVPLTRLAKRLHPVATESISPTWSPRETAGDRPPRSPHPTKATGGVVYTSKNSTGEQPTTPASAPVPLGGTLIAVFAVIAACGRQAA
jgi:iron complex transport system substrate-binding protein